jgi:hypothetical protein
MIRQSESSFRWRSGEQATKNTLAVMALIGSIKMALLNIFDIMSAIILSIALPCNAAQKHTGIAKFKQKSKLNM